MRHYINTIPNILSFNDKTKEEALVKTLSLCGVYLDDLDKRRKPVRVLITGQIAKKELIESFEDEKKEVTVNVYRVPAFVIESVPSKTGNEAFDEHLTNGRLEAYPTPSSNILKFFKHSSKPLAIKANKEED